ncbi:a-factor receptor [Marasmius crinis-equi]|uniref:A-factor receptor n=1 Tax=Marasmius crinis-equi TaxID=585013 RepID=A0ABR3F4Q2_9AGAR
MADPLFPFFPILAFITFILVLIPLPWHLQQWNAGTCLFMFWSAIVCLIEFVNSLIWHGNVRNVAPVWCDISSQIIIASNAGIAAATVCISRRLYMITALRGFYSTKAERSRALGKDLSISIGIPILVCVLHFIVQPYRFDILEDVGCYPATYNTLLAYVLHYMWPIAMGLISFIYGCLALRLYHIRRAEISRLMVGDKQDHASLTVSRYFRLIILALVHVICTIPTGVFAIYTGASQMDPYGSAPRRDWKKVRTILGDEWRGDRIWHGMVEINRWMPVFCGVVFFLLFGFALEARRSYVTAWRWLVNKWKRNDGLPSPQRPKWRSWSKTSSISGSTVVGDSETFGAKRLLSFHSSRSSNAGSFTSTIKPPPFGSALDDKKTARESEYEEVHLSPMSAGSPVSNCSDTPTTTDSAAPLVAPLHDRHRTHTRNSSIMQFNPNTGIVQPLMNTTHDTHVESHSQDNAHDNDEGTITYYIDPKYGLLSKQDYETIYAQMPVSGH